MSEKSPILPPHLVEEREAVIAEIHEAFRGVTREGGVSWSETKSLDGHGVYPWPLEVARTLDKDRAWTELVDDPEWVPDTGFGGWSFLDPIGFRYYLPAAIVRSARVGRDVGILRHLDLREDKHLAFERQRSRPLDTHNEKKLSPLTPEQHRCVRRFLGHMASVASLAAEDYAHGWDEALATFEAHFAEP